MTEYRRLRRKAARIAGPVGALVGALLLSACVTSSPAPGEGIGFREARFQEISAMQTYRVCVDDAMKVDAEARTKGSPGAYLAAARLFEKCEAELGTEVAGVAQEERMRAYAVGIIDYVKGGDLARAQANLGKFEQAFADYDLYLPNGASFIDTMDLLTGRRPVPNSYDISMLNVSRDLGSELERVRFWKRN